VPDKEEVIGGWIKLHNEEHHNYTSNQDDQIKEDEMSWARSTHGN